MTTPEFETLLARIDDVADAVVELNNQFVSLSRSVAICQTVSAVRREQSRGWMGWVAGIAAGVAVAVFEFFIHRR